jgi:hypothetical protein
MPTVFVQDYPQQCKAIRALHDELDGLTDESLNAKIQQRFGSERKRLGIATKRPAKRGACTYSVPTNMSFTLCIAMC